MFAIFAIAALSLGLSSVGAQQWLSPCPSIFSYDPAGVQGDTWFGDMTLRTSETLGGIWVRVVFDRAPLEVGSDFGEVVQRESQEYLVRKPNSKLSPGETRKIRLSVKFNPLEPPPQVLGFRLNARVVCPENGVLDKNAPVSPVASIVPVSPVASVVPVTLVSQCPSVFSYEPLNETDKWHGVVQLGSPTPLNGVWLRIKLDTVSVQLGNWFGEVTTADNKEYLIKNAQFKINPGTPTPLRFFIKFNPGGPIPRVVEIILNTRTICPENVFVLPSGQTPTIQIGSGSIPPVVSSVSNQNFPVRPIQGTNDDDEFYKPDFGPNRKPLVGGETGQTLPPDYPFQGDKDFQSDDKILIFPKFYYVIQKFPHFTLIHVKRRNKGAAIGLGNFELPFLI